MNKVKMILPTYVEKFRCIGGECEDNCCIGWDIDVDKETFKKYHKVEDKEMRRMFQKGVHNNPDCTNERLDYGRIKLNKEKRCPFLDENNFCLVQGKYGEDYLGSVCSQYPRVVNKIDDYYEMSIDMGCPEAARIVLGDIEKIGFVETERSLGKYTMAGILDTRIDEFEDTPIKYFKEIRDFSIKIIQSRNLDLDTRLYVLGDFINKLDDAAYMDVDSIKQIIDEYYIEGEAEYFERQDMNYMLQVSFLNDLLDALDINNDNDKIKLYSNQLMSGFELNQCDNMMQNADKYVSLFENYINGCMEKHSYIFENYMVNFIYNNLFPFSESDYMFDGYIMLLLRYSIIRFYLAGINSCNQLKSSEEIIKFIQVFAKTLEHNSNYRIDMLEYIKENGFDNIEFAKILI
ncbi:MAG TPA: FliB family protein [Clostridium sp.]|nr:FliB family protein [Clostridium sp.]